MLILKKFLLNISLIKFIKLFLEIQTILINLIIFFLIIFDFEKSKIIRKKIINKEIIKTKIFNEDFILLGPSLNVYYPIKSSIYSVSIRITGILVAIILDI